MEQGHTAIVSKHHVAKAVLEITVNHWSFSDQFQHLVDEKPFWLAKFTVNFQ